MACRCSLSLRQIILWIPLVLLCHFGFSPLVAQTLYDSSQFRKAIPPPAELLVNSDSLQHYLARKTRPLPMPQPKGLILMAVGDVMLGTDFPSIASLPPNDDPMVLLGPALPAFARADMLFGNLEGAFLDGGQPAKVCRDMSKCYLFRVPTRYARTMKEAGFTHLSLANNHVGDFGLRAQQRTIRLLDSLGIAHAGLATRRTHIDTIQGLLVGLCAFAPNSGTAQLNDYECLRRTVQALDSVCDIVIASCHMGAEGRTAAHITRKTEQFCGENRGNPYQIARVLIDAGADVVIGHGPHVPRAFDLYKGRFIAYSLGNFCTYGHFALAGISGYAVLLELQLDQDGAFRCGQLHPFRQVPPGGLSPESRGEVISYLRSLTAHDIPEGRLVIDANGKITSRDDDESQTSGATTR